MDLVSVQCPSCGADLPPRAPTGDNVCDYCGGRFQVSQARSAHTMAGVKLDVQQLAQAIVQAQRQASSSSPRRLPDQPPVVNYGPGHAHAPHSNHAYAVAHQTAKTGRRVALGIAFASIVGVAVPAVIVATQQGAFDQVPGLEGIAQSVEHLLWDHVGGHPQIVDIGGKTAFIGRTRKVLSGDELYIDAYDAQTVERLWRIGPLGSYSEAYQAVHYGAVGDRFAITDGQAQVHIHDLVTGERLQTLKLTDKVEYLCIPETPEGDETRGVWLKQIDEKTHMFDLKTAKLTEAETPPGCFSSHWEAKRAADEGTAEGAPKVDGIEIKQVIVEGDIGVAFGVKSPGTPVPNAVGFEPKTMKVNWTEVVASVDAATIRREDLLGGLGGGRAYVVYGAGQDDWYLTAFDARAGTRIWEQKLRPLFAVDSLNGMTVTDGHVLLGRTSSLEVFDGATGKLLGTVGTETYD